MAEVMSSLESALALQERKDSLIFDRDLLSMGLDFGNQYIKDSSSGQPSFTYYDNDQHHREETNKSNQEIMDYSSKLHQIMRQVFTKIMRQESAAGINGNSWTITTAFTKIMRQVFPAKDRLSTSKPRYSSFLLLKWNSKHAYFL
ncbi:hypothetical protein LguiA_029497 [Lonicera macranthoides]